MSEIPKEIWVEDTGFWWNVTGGQSPNEEQLTKYIRYSDVEPLIEALRIILWRHDDGEQGYTLHAECAERARKALEAFDD